MKSIQRWLVRRWPDTFTPGPDLKPLSLNIYKDILGYRNENAALSGRTLSEALKRHTTSHGYLYGVLKNTHRYDLAGNAVGEISESHRLIAKAKLRELQKHSQRDRRSSRTGNSIVQNDLRSVRQPDECSPGKPLDKTPSWSKTPVIRYKRVKRKIVLPVETVVELAG